MGKGKGQTCRQKTLGAKCGSAGSFKQIFLSRKLKKWLSHLFSAVHRTIKHHRTSRHPCFSSTGHPIQRSVACPLIDH
jgi:hypothetical protein